VIDFGISKVGDAPDGADQDGDDHGHPFVHGPRAGPGRAGGSPRGRVRRRAILYCALTGQRPFDRGDPTATLTAVLTQDPPRPRSIEASIPEALEMVISGDGQGAEGPLREHGRPRRGARAYDPDEATETAVSLGTRVASGPGTFSQSARGRTPSSLGRQANEVAMARPLIVLLSGLGVFLGVGSAITAIAAVLRLSKGGDAAANLTGTEAFLLVLLALFAVATPLGLAVRHVLRTVWDNSVKALDLADRLRRPVVAGLCAYGFGSLLVRGVEDVLLRRAAGAAWPVWDLVLFVVSGAPPPGLPAVRSRAQARLRLRLGRGTGFFPRHSVGFPSHELAARDHACLSPGAVAVARGLLRAAVRRAG